MAAGARLTRHQDETLRVYTEDARLRAMLERAVDWWNRATPGAPVIEIVQDEEVANTVVRRRGRWNDEWQGLAFYPPTIALGHTGVIRLTPEATLGLGSSVNTDPRSQAYYEQFGDPPAFEQEYPGRTKKMDSTVLAHELGHALGLEHTNIWVSEGQTRLPEAGLGIMAGDITPNHREQYKIRKRFGYTVNGIVGDQATAAYVRFINKSERYRAHLHARRLPQVNTPTETRTVLVVPDAPQQPSSKPEDEARRARANAL